MSERQHTAASRGEGHLRLETELENSATGHGRPGSLSRSGDLSVCPCCQRDRVYPVDWEPAGHLGWNITLRCPECEWRAEGVYSQEIADRFDEALDRASQSIFDDLQLLHKANSEEQIERFRDALERDLILPEDF